MNIYSVFFFLSSSISFYSSRFPSFPLSIFIYFPFVSSFLYHFCLFPSFYPISFCILFSLFIFLSFALFIFSIFFPFFSLPCLILLSFSLFYPFLFFLFSILLYLKFSLYFFDHSLYHSFPLYFSIYILNLVRINNFVNHLFFTEETQPLTVSTDFPSWVLDSPKTTSVGDTRHEVLLCGIMDKAVNYVRQQQLY